VSTLLREQPIDSLKGVGPKLRDRLSEAGIATLEDLLFHFPLRYQDRTRITPIAQLRDGADAIVSGVVRASGIIPGRRRTLMVKVADDSGLMTLRFFHFRQTQAKQFTSGAHITVFGQVRRLGESVEMAHPEYRIDESEALLEPSLTPVYPTLEGIGQTTWRRLCAQAITALRQNPPEELLTALSLGGPSIKDALIFLHQPPPAADLAAIRSLVHPAQLKLAQEELLAHQLAIQEMRAQAQTLAAPKVGGDDALIDRWLNTLPFSPTQAQRRVDREIAVDMGRPWPMMRLVQGDVGSGKTLVAALAALRAIHAGYQVALMAPTELLAEQHLRNFSQWFDALGIHIVWLSGKVKGVARASALGALGDGSAQLIIGTHALFQEQVQFCQLGLVIVDEQHRFGVHQRLSLTEKSPTDLRPHQLVLTATPIPRTLSMVAYADLDCSVIDELPPGRTPVKTALIDAGRRDQVITRVGEACQSGRQAYWVCTLIEESEALQAQAAEVTATQLAEALPHLRVALIHGRLKSQDKESLMQRFQAGEIDLLVATTVIEVGVDVANASLMIIENPERLGLAQLHQLRGRVGRGRAESHCLLLYQTPLSHTAKTRLQVMRDSHDGFWIAEKDLEIRGPGEMLGTRQTGLMQFKVAQLPEHAALLDDLPELANQLKKRDPESAQRLTHRWARHRQAYAHV